MIRIFSRLNKREKILSLLILFTLICWGCYSFLFQPLLSRRIQLQEELRMTEDYFRKLRDSIHQSDLGKNEFRKMTRLPQAGTEAQGIAHMLKVLDETQKQSEIQITGMTPMEPENLSLYKRISVRVELEDSMEKLLDYILKLARSPEKLNLVSLNVVSGPKNETLKASLIIAQLLPMK